IDLRYENDALSQDYRVSVEPASAPIDHVVIYSTVPLGDAARWLDKATNSPITAEKLAQNDPQRVSLPKEGDAWLLRFGQPTSRTFEVSTSLSTKRLDHLAIPLLCVPDATRQDGRILVRSRSPSALWIEPIQLRSVPLPPDDARTDELKESPPI